MPASPRIVVQLQSEEYLGVRVIAVMMTALAIWLTVIGVPWLLFEAACMYFLPGKS